MSNVRDSNRNTLKMRMWTRRRPGWGAFGPTRAAEVAVRFWRTSMIWERWLVGRTAERSLAVDWSCVSLTHGKASMEFSNAVRNGGAIS